MTAPRRRRAWLRGRRGEALAAWWLRLKGYRLVARNFRSSAGEIDLIVWRGKILAMVEVKTRGDLVSASEALGARYRSLSAATAPFGATVHQIRCDPCCAGPLSAPPNGCMASRVRRLRL